MTLDGKIASYTGDSKWITNEKSRELVHKLRSEMMGIVAGIGTVKSDDPMLNCRLSSQQTTDNRQQTLSTVSVRQPIRIIVDTKASIPLESQIVKTAKEYRTILAVGNCQSVVGDLDKLKSYGVEILSCKEKDSHVDINDLMAKLGAIGIDSLLLEGGSSLNAAFLQSNCVDEVYAFIAPKIIGGEHSKSPIGGKGIELMRNAITLKDTEIEQIGSDVLIKCKVWNSI